ncbi:MAG: peptidoglycan recognition protein [Actinobacteria bacterium]|nr:peptidoglycan recognition protein [Actinomycetota bacterium]
MSSRRLAPTARRRHRWGSPLTAVLCLVLVATSLPSQVPVTLLPPTTVASTGSAATESQTLAADIQRQVREGIDVAAQRADVAPFDLLGVSWAGGAREPVQVRVRDQGGWSEWRQLEAEGDDAPDPGSTEGAGARVTSEPVWVGGADGYEVDLPEGVDDVQVHLVRDQQSSAPEQVVIAASRRQAKGGGPAISSRSSWDAREPKTAPTIAPRLAMAFVHHTVSTNDYAAGDVPAMLRGIQAYHMDVNGWDDIGYNFLVDRFGGIWEGRAGGTTRNVVGAHAAGFNTSSVGVAVLGDFTTTAPSAASVSAVGQLLGWRLGLARVEPKGTAAMPSGDGTRSFAAISGHRDAAATECPGQELFARLAEIRDQADAVPAPVAQRSGRPHVPS